jgi:hypothetical protein
VVVGAAATMVPLLALGMDFQDAAGKELVALQARQQELASLAEKRCAGNIPIPLQNLATAAGAAPVSPATPSAPSMRQLECSDPDGARFRVLGSDCPPRSEPQAVASATAGQIGQVRCPAPGVRFVFSNSDAVLISVQDVGNHACRYRSGVTGTSFERILTFNLSSEIVRDNADRIRSIIPLQVGHKTSFHHSGGRLHYELSVESYEEAVTPVGRFPAFVLLYREIGLTSPSTQHERRWWYAPSIGYAVKYEYRAVQGAPAAGPRNWELVEIQAA